MQLQTTRGVPTTFKSPISKDNLDDPYEIPFDCTSQSRSEHELNFTKPGSEASATDYMEEIPTDYEIPCITTVEPGVDFTFLISMNAQERVSFNNGYETLLIPMEEEYTVMNSSPLHTLDRVGDGTYDRDDCEVGSLKETQDR